MVRTLLLAGAALALTAATPPAERLRLFEAADKQQAAYAAIAKQIWGFAELGYREKQSVAVLKKQLAAQGFTIQDNTAGIDTAFVATWGSGQPVIAIIGEYDALPGLSQQPVPEKKPLIAGGTGHGCGHNLFGAASALAAALVKDTLQRNKLPGTIRYYATPAEEGGGGKVHMLRAGAFKDVDVALVWHPWDSSAADDSGWLANLGAKVRYKGRSSHAAAAPDQGRSALDGVEIFTHALNLLREHVPQETRMHYVITQGGAAANIVPESAEVSIIVRHPDLNTLKGIWERVQNCIQAGAMGSGTTTEIEITSAYANLISLPSLVQQLDQNLRLVGGIQYTPEERAFAEAIRKSLPKQPPPPVDRNGQIMPPVREPVSASTDVGDISWNLPTGQFLGATWVPGTPAHSWQSTAASGTSIGEKGMLQAAKTLALTALDLFYNPRLVAQAKADFAKKKEGREYESLFPAGAKPAPR